METISTKALEYLRAGRNIALAAIVSSGGSTPRGEGSKMLIAEDEIFSTIGGGGMEGAVISNARSAVLKSGKALIEEYDMSGGTNADLICGGACQVLIIPVRERDIPAFEAAQRAEQAGEKAYLIYIFGEKDGSCGICANIGGNVSGEIPECAAPIADLLGNPLRAAVHGDSAEGVRCFIDPVNPEGRMLIFGAGHVSKETERLAASLDFDVTVFDDRADYASAERFPGCSVCVLDDFEKLDGIETDKNSYVLIITRGHAHDRTVLEWAINKELKYLGMIGSRSKRDALYERLVSEGKATRELLNKVKCPIGLSIGAETPAEIAVSIMAEIIAVRHE
ncbi:MAG: XdhC family protein [Oscillospiraceae bacterium]|nr:XdhC family protein [Oscillospiraceae bacterium]